MRLQAAEGDGAGPLRKFINITLPQITAILSILFMIRFIWNFNKFEDIFLLTGGASGTRTLPINVYEQGFSIGNIGMGSAVSMVIVLLLLFFMLIYFKLIGKYLQISKIITVVSANLNLNSKPKIKIDTYF